MEVYVKRVRQGKNSTLSELYIGGEHICYVLEDSVREEKIPTKTAIPAGRYKLAFRQLGGMHGRYSKRFPRFHKFYVYSCFQKSSRNKFSGARSEEHTSELQSRE